MSTNEKISECYPDNDRDLESNTFGPEPLLTASDQRLILFSHIIRAFGITIALVINAIIFTPFFIFGILPILLKTHFSKISTSIYPRLAPTTSNDVLVHPKRIFLSHDQ